MAFSKKTRKEAYKRAWGRCEYCGRSLEDGWQLDAHHRTPQSFGGLDTLDNCVMACLECHAERHEELGMYRAVASIEARMRSSCGGRTRKWLAENH